MNIENRVVGTVRIFIVHAHPEPNSFKAP